MLNKTTHFTITIQWSPIDKAINQCIVQLMDSLCLKFTLRIRTSLLVLFVLFTFFPLAILSNCCFYFENKSQKWKEIKATGTTNVNGGKYFYLNIAFASHFENHKSIHWIERRGKRCCNTKYHAELMMVSAVLDRLHLTEKERLSI